MEAWGSILYIVAPVVLVAAIAFAMLRNRQTKAEAARTEAATRAMYEEQDRADKADAVDR